MLEYHDQDEGKSNKEQEECPLVVSGIFQGKNLDYIIAINNSKGEKSSTQVFVAHEFHSSHFDFSPTLETLLIMGPEDCDEQTRHHSLHAPGRVLIERHCVNIGTFAFAFNETE